MPRPRYHAALSLGIAGLFAIKERRWQAAVPVLVAGVLVDFDHLVDFAVARQRDGHPDHIILPLHAWEWVFALLARGTRTSRGLAGGLAGHLALDQHNHVISHPFFYWMVVRLAHGFRADEHLVHTQELHAGAAWMRDHPLTWR